MCLLLLGSLGVVGSMGCGDDGGGGTADAPTSAVDALVGVDSMNPDARGPVDAAGPCGVFALTSVTPAANSFDAPTSTPITLAYNCELDFGTVSAGVVVSSQLRGRYAGQFEVGVPRRVTFTPPAGVEFSAGELIEVTTTGAIESDLGASTGPAVWRFHIGTSTSAATMTTPTAVGSAKDSSVVVVGDIDGDKDIDVLYSHAGGVGVLINNGSGTLSPAAGFGIVSTGGIALGDLDGDGDLDLFTSGFPGQHQVYANNGSGTFSPLGGVFGANDQTAGVSLGDLDGDGDLDAYVTNLGAGATDEVFLNNGAGSFTSTGQTLDVTLSIYATLGDIDGDGDLDAVLATSGANTNTIRVNDGAGQFALSAESFGTGNSSKIALGDLDGDGDLDAVVTARDVNNYVELNNGAGLFTATGQSFGVLDTQDVYLEDLDGDGDLDVYFVNLGVDTIWLNNGSGAFTDTGQSLATGSSYSAALADLDGDNDLDVVTADIAGPPRQLSNN